MSWVIGMIVWPPRTLASAMAPTASTKVSRKPITMPGIDERQLDLAEHLPARGAEIEGGLARFVRHHRRCRASSGTA